jgi:hypothetical protein
VRAGFGRGIATPRAKDPALDEGILGPDVASVRIHGSRLFRTTRGMEVPGIRFHHGVSCFSEWPAGIDPRVTEGGLPWPNRSRGCGVSVSCTTCSLFGPHRSGLARLPLHQVRPLSSRTLVGVLGPLHSQSASLSSVRRIGHERIGLDPNQPLPIDEARHLHDGARRANRAENLSAAGRVLSRAACGTI